MKSVINKRCPFTLVLCVWSQKCPAGFVLPKRSKFAFFIPRIIEIKYRPKVKLLLEGRPCDLL